MKILIILLPLLLLKCGTAQAQQAVIYGPNGNRVGTVTTDSQGSKTIYGAGGTVTGRTATDRQGTTTVYDGAGRNVGSYTNGGKR